MMRFEQRGLHHQLNHHQRQMESSPMPKLNTGPRVAVAVPVLNAAGLWEAFYAGLHRQTLPVTEVVILDSTSTDATANLAEAAGFTVISIARADFNHGGTRQIAIDRLTDADVVIYLTQDAVLKNTDDFAKLVAPFADSTVGATYGRQLPRAEANALESHARRFNYPPVSQVKSWEDRKTLGIKATFLSNSFSAYRRTAIQSVGGFPVNTVVAEDALVAGKMLMAGWKTVYVGDAEVVHSHDYSIREEFSRYFDTGVYHERDAWLLENFGSAGGEGKRFVISEITHLLKHAPHLLPEAIARTGAKWLGYKLGRNEAKLSPTMRRRLSMHKRFWDKPAA
jgi:rhamnosyltransferase